MRPRGAALIARCGLARDGPVQCALIRVNPKLSCLPRRGQAAELIRDCGHGGGCFPSDFAPRFFLHVRVVLPSLRLAPNLRLRDLGAGQLHVNCHALRDVG